MIATIEKEKGQMPGKRRAPALKRAALAALFFIGSLAAPAAHAQEAEPLKQVQEVFQLLESMHISGTSGALLRDAAIKGMIEALNDPYTQYFDEEEWADLWDAYEQNAVGIGILFVKTEEGLLILRVFEGSAAEAAGLRPGDIVIGADGESLKDYQTEEIAEMLAGEEGTSVHLEIMDGSTRKVRSVTIVRRPFHVPSVDYGIMEGGIGVIRISSFSSDTADLVGAALASFAKDAAFKGLIIDLRGNPGGYLDAVRDTASYFIEEGTLMHAVGRNGKEKKVSIRGGSSVSVPVALLVDEHSASGSEVLAGAMQDYEKAVIVGARTFGKGSVQQLVPLETGGGLRVTVEHYFTPLRRPVNGVGIVPDIQAARPLEAPLAGLRAAGAAGKIRAELKAYGTVINGFAFEDVVPVLREEDKVYVSSHALAVAAGGEAVWNGGTSTVTIRGKHEAADFRTSDGLILKDGASYIEISAFARAFSGIRAESSLNSVLLEWDERG